jgi:hypothetical protein
VAPTAFVGPGTCGPGQEHRDGPLTDRQRTAWNFVIGGLTAGAVIFFALTAIFHWF